jgi:hypothetical protein
MLSTTSHFAKDDDRLRHRHGTTSTGGLLGVVSRRCDSLNQIWSDLDEHYWLSQIDNQY